MATIKLTTTIRTAMAQSIIDAIDAGSGPGVLEFFDGAMPAAPGDAIGSQVLLGALTLSDPCATYAAGAITFGAIAQDAAADATGTALWARLRDSAGVGRVLLDVGNNASTAAIKMNTTSVIAGGPIQVTSLVISLGG